MLARFHSAQILLLYMHGRCKGSARPSNAGRGCMPHKCAGNGNSFATKCPITSGMGWTLHNPRPRQERGTGPPNFG